MVKGNGEFLDELGGYVLTSLPEAGNYEYIYKNDEILLKLDQFGLVTAQIDPPTGEAPFKREEREVFSPLKIVISDGTQTHENFDAYLADSLSIRFLPESAKYSLKFGESDITTELFVCSSAKRFVMNVTVLNVGQERKDYSLLTVAYPYLNELLMAPWDKNEWYTKTQFLKGHNAFLTTKYSVNGKKDERRYMTLLESEPSLCHELSYERLLRETKNLRMLPDEIGTHTGDVLYAFKQCAASLRKISLNPSESFTLTLVCSICEKEEDIAPSLEEAKEYLSPLKQKAELTELKKKYDELFKVKTVKTPCKRFDGFVNGFLPLELSWVASLDRGWPTGMRGVRDASNDFEGMLGYDDKTCREVIANIFSKQRSDGWYPRQVPFGNGNKFDLREFVDSACFFTEFVYDYLSYTSDYSILQEKYHYYDKNGAESGLIHLKKGIDFLIGKNALGEHGLVKMRGGDWLDCLSGAGKEGRGESVMVSCQLLMSLDYLLGILKKLSKGEESEKYIKAKQALEEAINLSAWNGSFYNAVYCDSGRWLFSDIDEDGQRRVYAPTNSYAIISGAAKGKEEKVLEALKSLRSPDGYKLFSSPLGGKEIKGIGKMGSGDFAPYFAENGSVYNHGSQLFYLRALAKAKKYQDIDEVLRFALPCFEDAHPESKACAAPYAITNCYHLVPSFEGRTGFSFLTGSVAMIEKAVYSWIFGVSFSLDEMKISPCVPKGYKDATITFPYSGHRITIEYEGYGANIEKASANGKSLPISEDGSCLGISKELIQGNLKIIVKLSAK